MLKFSHLALGLSAVLFAVTAQAKLSIPTYEELPELEPEGIHQTSCTRTANSFFRAHYKAIDVNDAFADKVIKQLLYLIDYNKSLFTQGEVDAIYQNRERIIRALVLCDLSYPYEIFNNSIKKRFNKYSFFVDQISNDALDLSAPDVVEFDRKDAEFLPDEAALQHQWLVELKNDYILQLLSDKTPEEAKSRLLRRYNAALGRLAQTTSEDVFSIFENSFATAIDPHTSYLSPDDSENFNDNLNLSLEGIGAVLTTEDEYTVINSILPGSPAERSKKLKAKDKIVGVRQADGTYEDIIGWRLNDVVKKIKGPKGTKVTLDIERGEGSQMTTFSVDIIRDKVRLQDSEAKIELKFLGADGTIITIGEPKKEESDSQEERALTAAEQKQADAAAEQARAEYEAKAKADAIAKLGPDCKKIGVLRIKSFYTNLHQDIKRELERVQQDGTKLDALIVDLRNNGGGLLPEATLSSGLFIKQGPIVLVRDARGNVIPQFDTDPSVSYEGPLVVLINRLSASSSEIMAAALRDYGRALVVGDTSFGKGTVQQSKPLARVYDFNDSDFGSIHYTIAKFYRINGGSTQLKGVSPDIYLPTTVDNTEFGESSEPNALPWDKISAVPYEGYLNIAAYVPELTRLSQARSADNVFFEVMKSDLERYYELKDKKVLSVNLEERKALKEEDDAYRLKTVNARLEAMGEPTITDLDDLDEDFEFDDAILDETVAIASDFAAAQKKKLYEDKNMPVLTRYQIQQDEISKGSGLSSPPGAAAMPARPMVKRAAESVQVTKGATINSAPAPEPVANDAAAVTAAKAVADKVEPGVTVVEPSEPGLGAAATQGAARAEDAAAEDAAAEEAADVVTQLAQGCTSSPAAAVIESGVEPAEDAVASALSQDEVPLYQEMDNMAEDGSLLGPWRTVNEDDTFLRLSDQDFRQLVRDSTESSMSKHLEDSRYPSIMRPHQDAVANDSHGTIVLQAD